MPHTISGLIAALLFLCFSAGTGQAQSTPEPSIPTPNVPGTALTTPAERSSGFEAAAAQLAAAERYRSACRDIREISDGKGLPANSTLRDFSGSPPFIEAITEFCAYGDFFLRGQQRGQTCDPDRRMKLDRRQFTFISSLNKISDRPIGRVLLECVEYDARLFFENFEAISIRLATSRFESMVVFGGKYALTIDVAANTDLRQGLVILGATINGSVRIEGSNIGLSPGFKVAFGMADSTLRNLTMEKSKFGGAVDLLSMKIDGDVRIAGITIDGFFRPNRATIGGHLGIRDATINGDVQSYGVKVGKDYVFQNTTINGKIEANRADIGTLLEFRGSTVTGEAQLRFINAAGISIVGKTLFKDDMRMDYARVGSQFWIDDADFEKVLMLSHANVDGLMLIRNARVKGDLSINYGRVLSYLEINDSKLAAALFMDNLRTGGNLWLSRAEVTGAANIRFAEIGGRVYVNLSAFNNGLYMNRLRAGIVELRNSETPKDAQFTGTVAREVLVFGLRAKGEFFLGNSRLNVLAISYAKVDDKRYESEFGLLDCSDCVIDHYALIGAKMTRGVRFSGTRVNGSLNFSEGDTRSAWEPKALLDLTGLQAQVIQADDSDLRVTGGDKTCPNKLVDARLSGVRFDSLVGGRVMDMAMLVGPANASLFDRPVSSLKDWLLSKPSCWWSPNEEKPEHPEISHARFDPQPFEVFAAALDRSGRPESATELRILKRDEEIKVSDYGVLRRLALAVGKVVVGYGYENEKALTWFALLVIIGMAVYIVGQRPIPPKPSAKPAVWYAPDALASTIGYSLFYSVDRAVPQLTLDKTMDRYSVLQPYARYYFYVHRVLGASILIYAVAGLTGVLK